MTFLKHFYAFLYRLLYHELAWAYDGVSLLVSLGHWPAWRRTGLDFLIGRRVLEIGFGTGALLVEAARRGLQVTGLDASPAMQRIAARRLAEAGVSAPRVQGVAQHLPFPDSSFDSILCTFPAPFILDERTFAECRRVLRPGGRLVIVEVTLTTANPLIRLAYHLVFPPSPKAARRFHAATEQSGLHFTRRVVGTGPVRPVVFIGEKPA